MVASQGTNKTRLITTGLIAITMSLFTIYSNAIGVVNTILQNSIHLAFALVLVILSTKQSSKYQNWRGIIDVLLIIIAIGAISHLVLAYPRLIAGRSVTSLDIAVGFTFMIVLLEAARRSMGWALPILAITAIAYSYLGPYLPSLFAHKGYSTERLINYLFLTSDGIFGTALGVSATFIAALVLFAGFLSKSGAGQVFIDLALSLFGRTRGGPAIVAVVSSCFMGSISGSAAANVVTSGVFTIPLMKRVGYRSSFAAGVESVSSTGGMIMPPLMGAGAFLMAEYLGIPYAQVALAALVPALLYYISLIISIHLEAGRIGLKRLDSSEIPKFTDVLKEGWITLLPLLLLIYFLLIAKISPITSAMYAIGSILILSLLQKGPRFAWKVLIGGLEEGAKAMPTVATACATAGILVGVFMLTGLGFRLSSILIELSNGNLFALLFLTMIASIILGMGVPATPAYIIIAVLAIPSMIELGVLPMAAHMFAFYFGAMSNITPPVAVAAYAAAGLSGDSPIKVGIEAFRLGLIVFFIPFFFIYGPALLLQDSLSAILLAIPTALLGVFAFCVAIKGWLGRKLNPLIRLLLFIGGLALIKPGLYTDLIGLFLVGTGLGWHYLRKGQEYTEYTELWERITSE